MRDPLEARFCGRRALVGVARLEHCARFRRRRALVAVAPLCDANSVTELRNAMRARA